MKWLILFLCCEVMAILAFAFAIDYKIKKMFNTIMSEFSMHEALKADFVSRMEIKDLMQDKQGKPKEEKEDDYAGVW